jgi:threonine dehydrogenase-like Zn-dependent dehydrogenase
MGLGAIDYAIHRDRKPRRIVVTDIDKARLARASEIFSVEEAKNNGVELIYVNTAEVSDPVAKLLSLNDNSGYDDVFVFAPVKPVVEQADAILGKDGCLNFFAGPSNPSFSAMLNFYNVHYASTHIVGTSGGNTDDMIESLELMADKRIDPSAMITHIGGLDSYADTVLNLPHIPGGKKLIYTNISLPLTAISDFRDAAKADSLFLELNKIVEANNGLWCKAAEDYLMANAKSI